MKTNTLRALFLIFTLTFGTTTFANENKGNTKSSHQPLADTAITAKVKANLLADSDVKSLGISVETAI